MFSESSSMRIILRLCAEEEDEEDGEEEDAYCTVSLEGKGI